MLRRALVTSMLLTAWSAQAQTVHSSPLPIFDAESGVPTVMESIIDPNTLVGVNTVRDTEDYAKTQIVARVEDNYGEGFCSGFRIGPDLFMTNYHCWEAYQCDLQFHMGYETDRPEAEQGKWKCKEVLIKYEKFDFAIYRVEPIGEIPTGVDFATAELSMQKLEVGLPLLVAGHPSARPKEFDLSDDCHLTLAEPIDWYDRLNIQHKCDTEGGSSGSPVIDRASGRVIGIHWGATGGSELGNHAIPMFLLLPYVKEQLPDLYAELTVYNPQP